MGDPDLANQVSAEQYHPRPLARLVLVNHSQHITMTPDTRTGIRRLAIFSAAFAAGAVLVLCGWLYLLYAPADISHTHFLTRVALIAAVAGAIAYAIVRGLAWVWAGFGKSHSFRRPNYN